MCETEQNGMPADTVSLIQTNIFSFQSHYYRAFSNISLYIWILSSIHLNRKYFPMVFSTDMGLCFL